MKLILTTAIAAGTMALVVAFGTAPQANAQTPVDEDSVTGSADMIHPCIGEFDCGEQTTINARSGPSGEAPSGTVAVIFFNILGTPVGPFAGTVTCLNVDGNRAAVESDVTVLGNFVFNVEDTGGTGPDRFAVQSVPSPPTQCPAPSPPGSGTPVTDGDFVVHDAIALPTVRAQCKNGGWRNFPQFKNQGQCIAFVNHGS